MWGTVALSACGSLGLAACVLRILFPWLKYEIGTIRFFVKMIIGLKKDTLRNRYLIDIFESKAKLHPKKPFIIFQDNVYTYEYMDKQMNKVARAGLEMGLKKDDIVAMLMENEPDFVWTFYGLLKIGVQPAFLNFNLRAKSLLHCFTVSGSNLLIVGKSNADELIHAVQDIQPDLEQKGVQMFLQGSSAVEAPSGFKSFQDLMDKAPCHDISNSYRKLIGPRDPVCFIFTSGTTGLPKAAIVSQDKALKATLLMTAVNLTSTDIVYTPLPLYHSAAGLIALGNVVGKGATLVLRKKFSATHFWEDCRANNVTVIQYIGELCRYLIARPESPSDSQHNVRAAVGNGLRQDVWTEFQRRFKIPQICEFYAATEGNAGFINIDNKMGSVGRCSPIMRLFFPCNFVRYDVANDDVLRGEDGLCIPTKSGEPGLLVVQIKKDFEFDGYKGNKELSEKKFIRNVLRKGDVFFNSGDLLTQDENYFVYFTDRIGDTFRWKGENVSTIEVSNVMADPDWIEDANVYGVTIPEQDGRAGMAAITLKSEEVLTEDHLRKLFEHAHELLPSYAIPRFIRFQNELEVTSTFKVRKVELVKEAFEIDKIKDALYFVDFSKKTYVPLDAEAYHKVVNGKIRL